MTTAFDEFEKKARALSPEEKASLAHILILELDSKADPDAEEQWLDEAQRRYEASSNSSRMKRVLHHVSHSFAISD